MNQRNQFVSDIRLPLALLVIFCHATSGGNLDVQDQFPTSFCPVLASILGQIAVPAFFLLSGYLFFQKLSVWSWPIFFNKLKTRFFTLLVPYIVWILLYIVFKHFVMHQTIAIEGRSFLSLFWNYLPVLGSTTYLGFNNVEHGPILGPFWYIKDLMFLVLCSPLLYCIFRKKTICIVAIGILLFGYLLGFGTPVLPVQLVAVLFFSIGTILAIHSLKLNECFVPYKKYLGLLAFVGFVVLCGWRSELWCRSFVAPFFRLSAVLFVFSLADSFKLPSYLAGLAGYSFFVYAAHPFVVPFTYSMQITNLWQSPWVDMCVFFLRPIVVYVMLSGVCRLIQMINMPGVGYLIGKK